MTPTEAKHKIDLLSTEIEQHNYYYYVLDQPTISDFEFDIYEKAFFDSFIFYLIHFL